MRFAQPTPPRIVLAVQADTPKAIVIVDDETSFTDLLALMLGEHFNRPVLTFADPRMALESLPRLNMGVLVTDYYMPHISGLDLVRHTGNLGAQTPPCILMTGHNFEDTGNEADRMPHFKATLAKPFRWQELAVLIERHWPADAGPSVLGGEPIKQA